MSCWFARMVRMHPLWWRMVRSGKHCVTWQRSTCRFQGKQHQKEGLNKQENLRLTTINHPWNLLRAINGVNRVLNLIIAVNPINRLLNLIELNLNKESIKRPFQSRRGKPVDPTFEKQALRRLVPKFVEATDKKLGHRGNQLHFRWAKNWRNLNRK